MKSNNLRINNYKKYPLINESVESFPKHYVLFGREIGNVVIR